MSETPITDAVNKLRDTILAERDKGNIVFQALPGQFAIANLDEFIQQPAEGMLYDLNRSEVISLTFLKDPKWVNDFAVALVIRKLTDRLRQAEADLVKARVNEGRYLMWRRLASRQLGDALEYSFSVALGNAKTESEIDAAIDRAMKGK